MSLIGGRGAVCYTSQMRRLLALCILSIAFANDAPPAGPWLVLPFHNDSADPSLEWIGVSLAETIGETLAASGLPVVRRDRCERIARDLSIQLHGKLTKASMMRLGREANASRVVFGTFHYVPGNADSQAADGSLEISLDTIELDQLAEGLSAERAGPMTELSAIESRLAWRVLGYAAPDSVPSEEEFIEKHPPVRIDAMESYARGLLAAELEHKHRFFTRAVNLDADFAAPAFELGRMQWEDDSYQAAVRWLERVPPESSRYGEAVFLLGLCHYRTGDFLGAERAFDTVSRLAATPEVYNNLGLAWFRLGSSHAAEYIRWSAARQPKDPDYAFNTGYILWRQGDLDTARSYFETAMALDPSDSTAARLLERCRGGEGPRRGDLSSEGLERLKENYDDVAVAGNVPAETAGRR